MKRVLFLSGCWALVVTGAMHALGHVQMMHMPMQGANATETQLLQLMRSYRDEGTGRTTLELMLGFSLLFTILCAGLGVLGILSARKGGWNPLVARFIGTMAALMLTTSLLYFFVIPSTCLGIAFGLLAVSLVMKPAAAALSPRPTGRD